MATVFASPAGTFLVRMIPITNLLLEDLDAATFGIPSVSYSNISVSVRTRWPISPIHVRVLVKSSVAPGSHHQLLHYRCHRALARQKLELRNQVANRPRQHVVQDGKEAARTIRSTFHLRGDYVLPLKVMTVHYMENWDSAQKLLRTLSTLVRALVVFLVEHGISRPTPHRRTLHRPCLP